MKRIYLAGPMSGLPNYNFAAFDRVSLDLLQKYVGVRIVSPADLDREIGFDGTGDPPPGFREKAMKRDLAALLECDWLALLPGWENSKGAQLELSVAQDIGLRIYVYVAESAVPLRPFGAPPYPAAIMAQDYVGGSAGARAAEKVLADGLAALADPMPDAPGPIRTEVGGKPGQVFYCDPTTGARKEKKLERYDLIPTWPLEQVARVYGKGAEKYAERNWEAGYPWSLSYAALQRHINQYWGGQFFDMESGEAHLASAIFHCMALLEFSRTHPLKDDRPQGASAVEESPYDQP